MNPQLLAWLKLIVLVAALMTLVLIFPRAMGFVDMAARELSYLWWLILLVGLAIWLIWSGSKK